MLLHKLEYYSHSTLYLYLLDYVCQQSSCFLPKQSGYEASRGIWRGDTQT